ncbi:testicular haploid expressed gene protein-like isoform X2 [Xenia sp. Carnegie-2017]|uniref:testicular haploid expressed gene protein-like isoform X2 n=1 Tax=Xenia sp. Carnegie-2017 TaxID=2897299 RepID=UPI001F03AC37|nr:testicular haploid expressed gene protein-like isoform X2 [Xenia sp. Carnegie-2017]
MALNESRRSRIDFLSIPKRAPEGFIEDKQSVYSDNKICKNWSKPQTTTTANLSSRLKQISQSKTLSPEYEGDRPSPIWQVSAAAKLAKPSVRLGTLSKSKVFHQDYKPPKSVYSVVSDAAISARPSARVDSLAKPKNSSALPTNQSLWDWSEWDSAVTEASKLASPSDHILSLATPKKMHNEYRECREVQWNVTKMTMKALPSLRIQQLSRPKSQSHYVDHYDENAYKVSIAARHVQANPRLEELCKPLPRKVRQKKV